MDLRSYHPFELMGAGWLAGNQRSPLGSAKAVLRLLVHSNVFVSLSTTCVAVTTILLVDLPVEPLPLFVVFAATMFVYTLNRFTDIEEDERNVPERAAFTRRYGRPWLGLGIGMYVVAVGIAIVQGVRGAAFLLAPLIAIAAYSVIGIKRILLVKNLVVGGCWGVIPLGVGVYYDVLFTVEIAFLFGFVTAMITIDAAIFDVKDIEGDRAEGIRTVPNVFGLEAIRVGGSLATISVAAVVVAGVAADVVPTEFLVLLVLNAYVLAYVPFADPDRGPLYYGFVVDGEYVFLAAVVSLLEYFVW